MLYAERQGDRPPNIVKTGATKSISSRSARRGGIECCFRPDACCHTLSAFLRHSWPTRCRPEETLCSRTATFFAFYGAM
ncbi:hypothetical protein HMPREF1546_03280 [Oscillibacter sp. KLE 1745]|nr:hypothetical protein HMPREF1546_03280 [Oscillibacter sp. KLE 1745]